MIRNARRWNPLSLLLGVAAAMACAPAYADVTAPIDAFVCAAARRSPGSERPAAVADVAVADQFASAATSIEPANRLCAPASLDGAPPVNGVIQLVRHAARPAGPRPHPRGVAIDNALGAQVLDLGRPSALLAPSAVDAASTPPVPDFASHAVDRYQCYPARAAGDPGAFAAAGTVLHLRDASGATRDLEVRRPRRLCAAADVAGVAQKNAAWHLACYDVRPLPAERARGLHVDTGFGAATLDLGATKEVCLPSRAVYACNGAPELCDRRFDQVSYATTHNAFSNAEDGFTGPNQRYSVKRQLADGVRAFMLDTHYDGALVALCHEYCIIGERPLLATLTDMREFLEQNPYEIVSIIFESYVSAADTAAVFDAAGLLPHVHAQGVADPWPTLRELIAADQRLVVFTDHEGGAYPWYHDVWAYAFETHYSFATPADLDCSTNRGNPANSLFILNHFLTHVFGSPALADEINHNPLFIDRAEACAAADAALPNFVTVDFYDIGDVMKVVAKLNGL
jgi:hypothetical protein